MKNLIISVILCLAGIAIMGQNNIGINNPNPDPSAALDIYATNKGVLIPRMSTMQRMNIPSPANGLLVYDVNARSYWFYEASTSSWKMLINNGFNFILNDMDGDTYITLEENPDDDTARIYIAGNEKFRFGANGIEIVNTGNSIFIGEGAGENDDLNDRNNIALGYETLHSNTTGNSNVAIGTLALRSTADRNNLVAVGDSALLNNGIGASASQHATQNTAVGAKSMYSNTIGHRNTTMGFYTMYFNTTGMRNLAMGATALYSNTEGNNNTASGNDALFENTTGNMNTASGSQSLISNTIGNNNTANGFRALRYNTSGYSNVAIGTHALHNNMAKPNLVAVGDSALYNNGTGASGIEGKWNTAVGSKAMFSNTTGANNTGSGYMTLFSNIDGNDNSAYGCKSLYSNLHGSGNVAIGAAALYQNTSGNSNFAGGLESLFSNTSGTHNVAIGHEAMKPNISGSYNTAVGVFTSSQGTNLWGTVGIGFGATPTANDHVRIGNTSSSSIGGYANWTNLSDERFKKDVKENVPGLEFIKKLRPVTYKIEMDKLNGFLGVSAKIDGDVFLKDSKEQKGNVIQSGFIAQEVEKAANELGYAFSGIETPENDQSHYGIRYAEFVVPLVKGMQEQQEMIEVLNLMVQKQNEQIEELQTQIESLSGSNLKTD